MCREKQCINPKRDPCALFSGVMVHAYSFFTFSSKENDEDDKIAVTTSVATPSHRQTADEEKLLTLLTNEIDPKPPVGRNADVFSSSTQVASTSMEPESATETDDGIMTIGRRDTDKSVVLVSQINTTFSLFKSLCFWC